MKNRTRENCTSGSVRDEDGNILIYSALIGGTMETAASFEARNAPSSYPTIADDARTREVSPRCSSCEADEQGRATGYGAGGAKGGDQGECGPAKRAPGTGPGKCVKCAGPHTTSRKGKEEGEVIFPRKNGQG